MSGETEVVEEQVGATETNEGAEEHDADFDAGFAGAPTETPGQGNEGTEANGEEQPAAEQQPGTPASDGQAQPEAAPQPEFVQLTKQDYEKLMKRADEVESLKTTHQQQLDKAFGSIGGMQRILNDLRAQPAGEPLKLSEETFAELKAEYPELADLTIKGMQRVLEGVRSGGGGINAEAMEKAVAQSSAEVRTELIDSHLDAIVDGDWREEVKTPKYAEWIAKQDEATRALEQSSNLRDAAKLMRRFKAYRDAPPPAPQPQETPKPASTTRQRTIAAAAANPRGSSPAPVAPSEDDEFLAGYKSG